MDDILSQNEILIKSASSAYVTSAGGYTKNNKLLPYKLLGCCADHPGELRLHRLIAAAPEGGCTRLLSKDMQHGQQIEGRRVENPFLP